MSMPLNLLMVRHGESEGNVANRASRKGDHSRFENQQFKGRHSSRWRLSEEGLKQAAWAGDKIREMKFSIGRKYSSPYYRAMETMGHMRLGGQTMIAYELRERSWGELDRMSHEERMAKYGEKLKGRDEDPYLWEPPGGEPLVVAGTRLRDWNNTVWRECGDMECVVATCHAEVIEVERVVTERMLPNDYVAMRADIKQDIWNCAILHYSRKNPWTGFEGQYFEWVRLITPPGAHEHGAVGFDWQKIRRPLFSDIELEEYVMRHAPTITY